MQVSTPPPAFALASKALALGLTTAKVDDPSRLHLLFIATLFRYRSQKKFLLHGFVVMPDHVHVLITPAIDQSTARCIQLIKGGYSHAVSGQSEVWHSSHHEHRIRDLADFNSQLNCIANNPSRNHCENYPRVHTLFTQRLDPSHLSAI